MQMIDVTNFPENFGDSVSSFGKRAFVGIFNIFSGLSMIITNFLVGLFLVE